MRKPIDFHPEMPQTHQGEKQRFQTVFFKNLRTLLAMLCLPVMALALVILSLTFRGNYLEFSNENQRLLERAALATDLIWSQMERSCVQAAYDQSVLNLAAIDRSHLNLDMIQKLIPVQAFLRAVTGSFKYADYAILYLYDSDYYVSTKSAGAMRSGDTPSTYHPYALLRKVRTLEPAEGWIFDNSTDNLYRYVKVMNYQTEKGIMLLRCNSVLVGNQIMNTQLDYNDQRLLLLDESGVIMQDSDGTARGKRASELIPAFKSEPYPRSYERDGEKYFIARREACIPGWNYMLLSNGSRFYDTIPWTLAIASSLLLLLLGLCVLLAYRTARTICKPYQIILSLLRSPVEDAAQRYSSQWASYDELGLIYGLIHESKYQTYTMLNRLSAQQQALNQAQRAALQAQINPHFLFNTLESINWKIYEKLPQEREITGMLQQLSLLMRLSLQTDEPLTTVSREIRHAEVYLSLQSARFQNMFSVKWNVQTDIDDYPALNLSLQPLLENAISHGVKKLDSGGVIQVDCHVEDGNVLFAVSDNGPGFDHATLERVRRNLMDSRPNCQDHIGLANVNARLQLLFGLEYTLQIESHPFKHTQVTLRVPLNAPQLR